MLGWEEIGRQNPRWPISGHSPSLGTLHAAQDVTSIAQKLHQHQVHCNVWWCCDFLPLQHVLAALAGTVGTPQPQKGSCGWSRCLSLQPAAIPASQPAFGNELNSSRVLFSLRILHNLYLFAQRQLDVCLSA